MSAVLVKVEAVVQKIAQYAETLTTAAAAATAAFDPSVLPVKWAAGYAAFAGATRVAREYVNKGAQALPAVEAQASHFVPVVQEIIKKVEEVPAEIKHQVEAASVAVPPVGAPVPTPVSQVIPAAVVPAGPTGIPVAPITVPLPEPPAPSAITQ